MDRWETRWADTRIHGTTKRQVAAMFAEEQPTLGPLPLEPLRYYRYGERTVHLDGCVEVEAAYYGASPGWIGQRVQVQWNDLHVRLLAPKTGQQLREHLRAPRGWHKGQLAVDEASQMIVATRPTNCAADNAELLPLIDQAHATLGGNSRDVLADAGYHGEATFQTLEARDITAYISLGHETRPAKPPNPAHLATQRNGQEPAARWALSAPNYRTVMRRRWRAWDVVPETRAFAVAT